MVSVDLLCFSHLRWDFVYQRPNHLMARASGAYRVFYIEEPVKADCAPGFTASLRDGATIVVPHIPGGSPSAEDEQLRSVLDELIRTEHIVEPVLWYYTPMALRWTRHLHGSASACVYDCMDHLAGFAGAPDGLVDLERELMKLADLVFTGGASLHELKRRSHPSAHCFPSSVDTELFRRARTIQTDPADQAAIARPRIGYFGVLDERIDMPLLADAAELRPNWQWILVGPTAKIDQRAIPVAPNIHWVGPKDYQELPAYLGGWDVAMMPFAHNDATRFISPTKTPEYLAGGRPVISTSIPDVVTPYGDVGLVHVGDGPADFVAAAEAALAEDADALALRIDAFLGDQSWDRTWSDMARLLGEVVFSRPGLATRGARAAGAAFKPAAGPAAVMASRRVADA
jgi:UDP-galactopyranose mutase